MALLFYSPNADIQLTADEPQLQISTIKTKYLAPSHFADNVNIYAELTDHQSL